MKRTFAAAMLLVVLCTTQAPAADWRSPKQSAVLQDDCLTARFQAGILCKLTNRRTGVSIINCAPVDLDSNLNLFGEASPQSLDSARISETRSEGKLSYRYLFSDSASLCLEWKLNNTGDLVLRMSAKSPKPVHQIRATIPGLDITRHKLVTVSNFGIGRVIQAPFTDRSDVVTDLNEGWDYYYVQPLVALFEGAAGGFFMEGRFKDIGPARVTPLGNGSTTDLVFSRLYYEPSDSPVLYEVRIRAYEGRWQKAVDPFVRWMENGQGFVPLEKQTPKWIRSITGQTYNDPHWDPAGATRRLDEIASVLVPSKTIIGKTSEWRLPKWGYDQGWGDYSFSDEVRAFFKRAAELGFHQAVHFNCSGIDLRHKDLIRRFEPGLRAMGTNSDGTTRYQGYNGEWSNPSYGPVTFVWCSHAYQPFNDYMLDQIGKVVEAGVDIIYLDEAHTPTGRFLVDGKSSIQGLMDFMKQIRTRFPNVAIMTEQFNPAASRYASFALTSCDLGHPLSGYVFRRFVKVTDWSGPLWSPTRIPYPQALLESYWSWQGNRVPRWGCYEEWDEIVQTFQKYELEIDPNMPLKPGQLSAYRGKDGVTAYYERTAEGMGLVVHGIEHSE